MAASEVSNKKNLLLPILIILIVLALAAAGYFYFQYQKSQNLLKNPTISAAQEVKDLTNKVGQLIELPTGEDPTIATVSDKAKLADQPFFTHAQNEDKVLIYTKAKKAILYRPSTNKIIEVAPVNLGNNTQNTPAPSVSPTAKTYKAVLYNGTTTVGLTNTFEKDLKSKVPNVTVIDKTNAAKRDYTKTLVVDLSGSNPSEAQTIADALSGQVGPLPTSEKKPAGADFLIIIVK